MLHTHPPLPPKPPQATPPNPISPFRLHASGELLSLHLAGELRWLMLTPDALWHTSEVHRCEYLVANTTGDRRAPPSRVNDAVDISDHGSLKSITIPIPSPETLLGAEC